MKSGHLLDERYRIKSLIGGGGMANVYLAYDIILDRDVAIKVLRSEFANDPEFIERFDREAQAATSLAHPNIVNIYDVGEENNNLFIVMEYVDGLTLKQYIIEKGPLPVEEALNIMEQLTSAIEHAHANGLIHRDIKPQNILIDYNGNIKVTDFGIAVALSSTALTQTNSILGSVHYLSPEQARGGKATKKSDIYALGIVFYELLTGNIPFSGDTPVSVALQHLQKEIPSVRSIRPDVYQSVENIILKATTKNPLHRYVSVAEMKDAIAHALDPLFINEEKFEPPYESGEETKAIPIITDDKLPSYNHLEDQQTIIHQANPPVNEIENNEGKKKKRRKWKKWVFISLSIILLSIVLFIMLVLFSSPKDVVIPDVTDEDYETAVEQLKALNLNVNKETMYSEDIEEGKVVKTDPPAGRTVKEKTTIDIYVSEGKEKVEFEDYVGQNYNQVERLLQQYKEVRYYEVVSDRPVGEIVTQIQPAAGSKVVPSETVVIFEVSAGPKKIALGNLIGLTLEQVEQYIERNNFKLEVDEAYSDSVEKGRVSAQKPVAHSELTEGSVVTVTISKGPEQLPPRSHTVEFTVPFQPQVDDEGNIQTEQTVQIYVGDMNNNITEVFHETKISNDKHFELTLIIADKSIGEYRVVRDGVEIIHQQISY